MSDRTSPDTDGAIPDVRITLTSDEEANERPLSEERGRRLLNILSVAFVAIGAVLLLVAAWTAVDEVQFAARADTADGLVVSLRRDTSGGTAPTFRFTTRDGRMIVAETSLFTNPPAWRVGERATLRYDPAQPDHASPDTFMSRWFVPLLLGSLGTFTLVILAVLRRLLRA
ncbi:DUF3592 domain-containing protein [Roseomonas sp. CCTCC AB2023176]|uniref:DUF3592 domain-containing protein n=1 Tax=Roseomonas sp. CCTCC AB2023176 TaxID=3342640 RepID=UPI0035DCF808